MRDHERTFSHLDQFEHEELRHMEAAHASVDAMIASLFGFEVDLDAAGRRAGDGQGGLLEEDF